jgi:hypothetical protein
MYEQMEVTLDRKLVEPIVSSLSLLYQRMPDYDPDVLPEVELVLSLDDLKENDLTIEGHQKSIATYFQEFLKAILGDSFEGHPLLDTLVLLRYKDEVLSFVSRPRIAMHQGFPTLVMGAESRTRNIKPFYFPLDIGIEGITVKGSAIKRLSLNSLEFQKADGSRVKIPIACFNVHGTVYAIHVNTDPSSSYYDLEEAWSLRDAKKLGRLIASSYGATASLSQMFSNWFVAGTFPKDGIIIPLVGFTKEKVEARSSFWKVTYQVDCGSFPPVCCTAYYDGAVRDDVPLCLVNRIGCYQSDLLGSVAFTDKATHKPPSVSNPWYLYVKGADSRRKTPLHTVLQDILPAKQKRILELQQAPNYYPMPSFDRLRMS